MTDTLATWGGWAPAIRDSPFGHFAHARARAPVQQVRPADGHPAWVVLGYDASRRALNDPCISKDMLAALQAGGDVVAEGLPGPAFSRHMLNVDPPDHTRLRRLVSRGLRAGQDRRAGAGHPGDRPRLALRHPQAQPGAGDFHRSIETKGDHDDHYRQSR